MPSDAAKKLLRTREAKPISYAPPPKEDPLTAGIRKLYSPDQWSQPIDPSAVNPAPHEQDPAFRQRYYDMAKQMAQGGIAEGQRAKYPMINKGLYKAISPFGYTEGFPSIPESKAPERYDAWRMYMGFPQEHDTFAASPYRPSTTKDPNQVYYKLKEFWPKFAAGGWDDNLFGPMLSGDAPVAKEPYYGPQALYNLKEAYEKQQEKKVTKDIYSKVMGQFRVGHEFDEEEQLPYYSYYDKWDLDQSYEGEQGKFGKPYELYDRLYYHPTKQEVYWNGPPPRTPKNLGKTMMSR